VAAQLPDFAAEVVDPWGQHRASSCPIASFVQELNLDLEPTSLKGSRKHLDLNHLGHSFFGDLLVAARGPPIVSSFAGIRLCVRKRPRHIIGCGKTMKSDATRTQRTERMFQPG